jgi:integrase
MASRGRRRLRDGSWQALGGSVAANRRHLRRFVLLGLYTGTRPGVLPKLLWSENQAQAWIDLERGWIYRRGRAEVDHKTKKRPMIRIPRRLLAHLRRWHRLDVAENQRREAAELPLITTVVHHGARALHGKVRRGFRGLVRDAGLPQQVTPHWLRHTAATWLMEADVPGHRASQYLGMTVATLEKHYGHRRPDFQNDVGKAISRGGR